MTDHPHGIDFAIYTAAFEEAAHGRPWTIHRQPNHPCEQCGHPVPTYICHVPNQQAKDDLFETSVRAALLAGWNGKSGCNGITHPAYETDLRPIVERLQAQGFPHAPAAAPHHA